MFVGLFGAAKAHIIVGLIGGSIAAVCGQQSFGVFVIRAAADGFEAVLGAFVAGGW